jgi:hypothetical protein
MATPPANALLLPPDQVPPAPPMPTLSVTAKGVLHLHASLRERLSLRYGQAINLVPPAFNSYWWYLDLRPTAKCKVLWGDDQRMRAKGIILPPGLITKTLTLHLWTDQPEYPNYYPLLPSNAFTTEGRTPPLAAGPPEA